MEMNTYVNTQTSAIAQEPFTTGSVTSTDGTIIGFRQLGQGPGLVILHGSLSTGFYHLQLAQALADGFTVYLPDRRGFGLSGPCGLDDRIQKDVEDLDALLTKTGAHNLFGVSAGAIISLRAALSLPAIHKLAIYEPPIFSNPQTPGAMMAHFDQELAQGDVAAALTTAMKGAPLMSDLFAAMPRWLVEFMTKRMMSYKPSGDYESFGELAPTLHHDGRIIVEMSGQQSTLKAIRANLLLLGGSQSTAFLKAGLDSIAKVLPDARRVEFPGLNHGSSWNSDVRGKPEAIAQELRRFFIDP